MTKALVMTDRMPMPSRMPYQIPAGNRKHMLTCLCVEEKQTLGASPTDVFGLGRQRAAPLGHELVGVQTDLDDVVEQRQERRQRKRRHEDGGEAELQNCQEKSDQTAEYVGVTICLRVISNLLYQYR